MTSRWPGGFIRGVSPTVTAPNSIGEGGAASGLWTTDQADYYVSNSTWPKPRDAGVVYAWGKGGSGQNGNFTSIYRSSPVQVGDAVSLQSTTPNWTKLFNNTGTSVTFGIKNGLLYGWGNGGFGVFGTNSTASIDPPIQVSTDYWNTISSNAFTTLGIKTNNSLWSWGKNQFGQLGSGTIIYRSSPVQVGALTNWFSIASGDRHSLAVKTDGTLWAWGYGAFGQLGTGDAIYRSSPVQIGTDTTWLLVKAANYFSAGFKTDGTLWLWGSNTTGQLGINISGAAGYRSSPVQVGGPTSFASISAGSNGNYNSAYGIKSDGSLWSWGHGGAYGTLGLNDIIYRSSPTQIGIDTNWRSVSGGDLMAAAVRTTNTLWTWGKNNAGQLGLNNLVYRSSPTQVGILTNWSKIFVGRTHSVALKTDGTLWAWGNNTSGGLGNNAVIIKSSPVQVGVDTNWQLASSGTSFTIAIKTTGSLWAWGLNGNGELGLGDLISRSSPVQVGALTNWVSLSTGGSQSFAIKTDGSLWVWGYNGLGQLGLGNQVGRSSPTQVGASTDWSSISCAGQTVIAVKTDGSLWVWGYNTNGNLGLGDTISKSSPVQVGTLTNWLSVAAGYVSTYALTTNTNIWSWGNGNVGNLGDGTVISKSSPVQIGNDKFWTSNFYLSNNASTSGIVLAVRNNGTLWGWGYNSWSQLGDGTAISKSSPIQIGALTTWSSSTISLGLGNVLANYGSGLYAWGQNTYGQIGDNTVINRSSPVLVGSGSDTFLSFASGVNISSAIRSDGTLWSWGLNTLGELGLGATSAYIKFSSPVQVGTVTWSRISGNPMGSNYLGIKTDGSLWGWGDNSYGQLGQNDVINKNYPVKVSQAGIPIASLNKWSNISAGVGFSMAITNGVLYGWGNNPYGNYGYNDKILKSAPVQVGPTTNWSKVSAGNSFSALIKTDGSLWTTGYNPYGQLGIGLAGATAYRSSPVQVGLLTTWSNVSAGNSHTAAIKIDGTLWVWGNNSYGGLGLNLTTSMSSPVQVGALTNWLSVAAGNYHTFAIKTDGTLWSWGRNNNGELGLNNIVYRSSPVQIGLLTNWLSVAAGRYGALAIKTDGTLWTWGKGTNGNGQGNITSISSPTQIGSATNWTSIAAIDSASAAVSSFSNLKQTTWTQPTDGLVSTVNKFALWMATPAGGNQSGGLGQNTASAAAINSPVIVGNYWNSVSVGHYDTSAIAPDGTLWAWGDNSTGQLGLGDIINRSSPVQVGALTNWLSISAGKYYTSGIKTDGTLWTWGQTVNYGNLGLNDNINRSSPTQIGALTNWAKISNGPFVASAIKTDGTLWEWGYQGYTIGGSSSPVQIGTLTDWATINSTGGGGKFALKTDGTLWAWGTTSQGAFGNLIAGLSRSSPVQIGNDWVMISAGFNQNIGLTKNGFMFSWGANPYGELGLGDKIYRSSPTQIGTDSNWLASSTGGDWYGPGAHFAGIKTSSGSTLNGTLWIWGRNQLGQLGLGDSIDRSSPVQVGALTTWISVHAGYGSTFAIKNDNTLWVWGTSANGQLGNNSTTINPNSPVQIAGTWDSIFSTNYVTVAVKTDGTLWSWGKNQFGQLGSGTIIYRSSPVQVGALTNWAKANRTTNLYSLPSFSTSQYHVVALKTDNTLWAWGYNSQGQLASGNLTARSSPAQIGTDSNWSKITSGYDSYSLAIKTDGTLWGWGYNLSGQLGVNDTVYRVSPTQVNADNNWLSVYAGYRSVFTTKTNKTFWTWGYNTTGQLASGNQLARSSPVQVGPYIIWSSIGCGYDTILAVGTDGSLWTWGDSGYGNLGFGDTIAKSSPVQLGALTNWYLTNGSAAGSAAIKTDGTLWTWGLAGANGTGSSRSSPVQLGTATSWYQISRSYYYQLAVLQKIPLRNI